MKPAIAILGGSTPFTAALVEALRELNVECDLRLFGQDAAALSRMAAYAGRRLAGWKVHATSQFERAIDGAEIVVNQIRFGGMAGRARDEELAIRFGLAPDETLGPSAMSCALRIMPRIRELATRLARTGPHAFVLNLSNPLSLTTRALAQAGVNCIGVCELPAATVLETCRLLRLSPADVEWDYAGLNHRGFVFSLRRHGEDLLPQLPQLLGERAIFGITADVIRELGVLPLKYFRLSSGTSIAPRRAQFLEDLKVAIAYEMETRQDPPPSLAKRDLSWYSGAVVPAIAAILNDRGERRIVNCPRDDGLVHELPARVHRNRVEVEEVEPPPAARRWIDRWTAHERALADAVDAPSLGSIERALALDPAVPQGRVSQLASELAGRGR